MSLLQRLGLPKLPSSVEETPFVVVTVIGTRGSTPRKINSKMVVDSQGKPWGTIGGGSIEKLALEEAIGVLQSRESCTKEIQLTNELAMCCGGAMQLYWEYVPAPLHLHIFGAGHVGRALARLASGTGFEITLYDDLQENRDKAYLEGLDVIADMSPTEISNIAPTSSNYIFIATREHALDQRLLEEALKTQRHWVGVIGSERKAKQQLKRLEAKGYSEEQLRSLSCPVGIELPAETPQEIAVSICAELIQVKAK